MDEMTLLEWCATHGVQRIRWEGLDVEFAPQIPTLPVMPPIEIPGADKMSETELREARKRAEAERLLFASST
jgi:hypothetical protein